MSNAVLTWNYKTVMKQLHYDNDSGPIESAMLEPKRFITCPWNRSKRCCCPHFYVKYYYLPLKMSKNKKNTRWHKKKFDGNFQFENKQGVRTLKGVPGQKRKKRLGISYTVALQNLQLKLKLSSLVFKSLFFPRFPRNEKPLVQKNFIINNVAKELPYWLRKKALYLSQSAFSNFAPPPHVISSWNRKWQD